MTLNIIDKQDFEKAETETIASMLEPVLAELGILEKLIEIVILDDDQIAKLNEKFFSRSKPTNVISFPLSESGTVGREFEFSQEPEDGFLGEIAVSLMTIRRETEGLGYSLEEGVVYYLIHGILHLLGYEHVGVAESEALLMENRQEELFNLVLAAGIGGIE